MFLKLVWCAQRRGLPKPVKLKVDHDSGGNCVAAHGRVSPDQHGAPSSPLSSPSPLASPLASCNRASPLPVMHRNQDVSQNDDASEGCLMKGMNKTGRRLTAAMNVEAAREQAVAAFGVLSPKGRVSIVG